MHKFIFLLLVSIILVTGCSNQNLTKRQYYERGLSFLESGNPNGAIIAFKKAVENDQSYFEARYQLALAYIIQSKYESAEKELHKVLRLNPNFDEARLSLSSTFISSGRIDKAIEEINVYLSGKDDNPDAYELAARAYLAKKDYEKAEESLRKALKIAPERKSSKIVLAEIYIESGKTGKAETLIDEVIKSDDRDSKALNLYAAIKQKQGEFDDMISAYQKITEVNPGDIRAQFELGLSYLRANKPDKAREIADKLVKLHENRPESFYLTGLVDFYERRTNDAITALQKAVKFTPVPGAYYYLGVCRMLKGNFEQAATEFQRALDIRPDMVQARLMLAMVHLKKGRAEPAERELQKVLKTDENNAFAHNLLGSVYLALGRNDSAMEEFDRAIDLNPGLIDAYIKKGASNLMSGDPKKAEEEFINAVEIAPDVLDSRIILARHYIKSKRFKDAIVILKQGLKENPNDAVLYNIIGAAYLGTGDMEKAGQSFEKAIASNPNFFLPYFNLARLFLMQDDKAKAIKEYERVLYIDDNNVAALLMLAKIKETENKDKEALYYYKKAKKQGKPIAYLSLAEYYQRKKDGEKAIEVLDEAISVDSENIKALDMKGRILYAGKKFREALSVYEDLKGLQPDLGAERMARVYSAMGQYDKAIMSLKELPVRKSARAGVLTRLVNLYLKVNNFKEAERNAKEIIDFKPESDIGYKSLAAVYLADKKNQKALEAIEKARKLNPDNLETKLMQGRIHIAMEDLQKAMKVFNQIEKINPEYAPVFYYQASTLEMMGKKKEAVEKHKKTLEFSPDHIPSLNNLAYLYAEGHGPVEEAVLYARKAKDLSSGDGSVTDTLGWVLFKMGNYNEALNSFIEATHYLPAEPSIRYHLGLAYLKKGNVDKAEEQLKNAVRLGRESVFPELKDTQIKLERLKVKR